MQLCRTGEMNFKGCQVPLPSVALYLCNSICVLPTDVQLKVLMRMAFEEVFTAHPSSWAWGPDHYSLGPLATPTDIWCRPCSQEGQPFLACCFSPVGHELLEQRPHMSPWGLPLHSTAPGMSNRWCPSGSPGSHKGQRFWLTMQPLGTRVCMCPLPGPGFPAHSAGLGHSFPCLVALAN